MGDRRGAKRTLVDGYNLAAVLCPAGEPRADALERARETLLRRLRAVPATIAEEIVVVFDGRSGLGRGDNQSRGAVQVRFARGEGRADAMILDMLAEERDRSRVTVVTSDRELAGGARRLGARVVSSDTYAKQLEHPVKRAAPSKTRGASDKPPPPGPAEVMRWEQEFTRRTHDPERDQGGDS